jgi:hypothetical protein
MTSGWAMTIFASAHETLSVCVVAHSDKFHGENMTDESLKKLVALIDELKDIANKISEEGGISQDLFMGVINTHLDIIEDFSYDKDAEHPIFVKIKDFYELYFIDDEGGAVNLLIGD